MVSLLSTKISSLLTDSLRSTPYPSKQAAKHLKDSKPNPVALISTLFTFPYLEDSEFKLENISVNQDLFCCDSLGDCVCVCVCIVWEGRGGPERDPNINALTSVFLGKLWRSLGWAHKWRRAEPYGGPQQAGAPRGACSAAETREGVVVPLHWHTHSDQTQIHMGTRTWCERKGLISLKQWKKPASSRTVCKCRKIQMGLFHGWSLQEIRALGFSSIFYVAFI